MTADERRRAIQALIGAELAIEAANQQIKKYNIARGRVSSPTVSKVLQGRNCKISSLFEVADSLDCDVEITIHKRTA